MSSNAPPAVLKEGFLSKRSRNAWPVARFQRRYFRLYPGELQYFYTPQETVPRRRVALRLDTRVTPTNDQGYERCFVVKTSPTENFYVQSEREDEKDDWVMAIYNALRRTDDVAGSREEEVPSPRSMPMPTAVPAPPPARILLNLTVVGAKNLKGVNYMANAKSDPYCVINFIGKDGAMNRSEEVKTKYVTDTVNPEWKEKFRLGHAVDLTSVEAIHFELLDHEVMGKPKPLGFVKVPLSTFRMSPASTAQSELVDRSFRVHPPPERPSVMDFVTGGSSSPRQERKEKEAMIKDHGELRLVMSVVGPNLVHFFRSLSHTIAPQNQVVTKSEDHSDNRLEVTVLCARDLIAADFNKSSDPFVELKLLDDKSKSIRGEYYRTTTKEKTKNPAWQDEHCVFGRVSRIEDASYLHVRVMDWDQHSKNDPLGYVVINLAALSAHSQTDWYTLLPEDKMAIRENLGCIQLKISLAGETHGERERRLQIEKQVASKTHEVSAEQLELENAQLQLHEAACSLDGARIACAVNDYQAREPQFYGMNGCIHYLNAQLPRAHRETTATEEGFHSRTGIEGQALLEVSVVGAHDLKKSATTMSATSPYALIEVDPSVCIEECKRISAPQSPRKSKRVEASMAATEARAGMFERRAQAEVSSHRAKLGKNEMRSERHFAPSDQPMLKVEVKSGQGLIGVDFGGYSDPYCTLTLTDRVTGKPLESEKKRTAVISKTLNPVWENEVFLMGSTFPLEKAGTLLIHVKDHNMTRSTPLGRVQIPLSDLCHASATTTSISSTAKEKRYALMPEPWMKKHAQNLGELCIKTEVIGDATVLAEMLQRSVAEGSPAKILSFLSMQSFSSEAHLSEGMSSMSLSGFVGDEDETTEIIEKGKPIRTATVSGTSVNWRKEDFQLSLSYPGMFSGAGREGMHKHVLRLRVHGARNLLGLDDEAHQLQGKERSRRNHLLGQRAKTSAYFTVIPVYRSGHLEDSQRKQSLTVYGTRNPNWPDREFVFDKLGDLQFVSHLSLHVYSRDLESEVTRPIAELLTTHERDRMVRLERFQIRKIGATGLVEDNGYEVLPFGQRVLAYRKCGDGGRFFPATIRHYTPSKIGSYDVLFEDDIETIDDLWDLFSLDVKGKIELIHSDGTVDVSIETTKADETPYARNVSLSLLKPVDAFTDEIESVMARCMDEKDEVEQSWKKLKHTVSQLTLRVASVTGLPKYVSLPRCEITFIGIPPDSPSKDRLAISETGQLMLTNGLSLGMLTQEQEEKKLSFNLNFKCDSDVVPDQKHFEDALLTLGGAGQELEKKFMERTASLLIEIVAGTVKSSPTETTLSSPRVVIGSARVDLVTLSEGPNELHLRLLPPATVDYYKYVGSLTLKIECEKNPNGGVVKSTGAESDKVERGASAWFEKRGTESVSSRRGDNVPKWSRISRRRHLRSSLTPTENGQIDAFHTVLVIVMKRIISILREIQLFDDFEDLATEDFPKFHHVHYVSANPKSEWIGRPINEIPLETRKAIVENLELELLEIAGSGGAREQSSSGPSSREEWMKQRTERQQQLLKVNGFFMQDRSSAGVLSVPCCFTGEGMINWIKGSTRKAPVLWQDGWRKYCDNDATKEACKLGWKDPDVKEVPNAKVDPDALEDPKTERQALLWLNALSDAGFIENVTPTMSIATTKQKSHLVESKPDCLYRLREVERWVFKQARDKSLCPLDLVPEVDCWQQIDLVPHEPRPSSPPPSPKKRKEVSPAPAVVVDKNDEKNDAIAAQKRMYAKKLLDHVEGFLGLQNVFSGILFSEDVQDSSLLKPVAAKTQQLIGQKLLWDWKYCLFIPGDKMLYVYESEFSNLPTIILDMNNSACRAAYNFTYEKSGGWFNVVGAAVMHASIASDGSTKYVTIDDTLRDRLMKVTKDGTLVFEFKAANAQLWVQSFLRANVRVDMKPNQPVVLKRLNPTVLQTKCTDQVANYNPNDLEGSFQGMLNKFFKHCGESSHTETEQKMRELRARVRNELKKPGALGEAIMAYFGSTKKFNPGPTNERAFASHGELKSGRILRIRAPFVDSKDNTMPTYEIKDAPQEMKEVLNTYDVSDKSSWLKVPRPTRDIFLLYDIEYNHDHEIIREEDLLRVHVRTNGGDLDPSKVKERCTDLNIWFKPSDLEDCVTRIVMHTGVRKPLGCLKIPLRTVSARRVMDVWYPLGPDHEMVQKAKLGQIRVQLRLVPAPDVLRSKKMSANLSKDGKQAEAPIASSKPLAVTMAALTAPFKWNKSTKQIATSPTAAGASPLSHEPSFITIRIIEGRKLLCADIDTNTSDPYVQIVLVRESDGKEESTKLKTDIKYKTLSPKWSNQEFVLGKSPDTVLSDKKAILLRVMDHDFAKWHDQMGCMRIELVRDKSHHISGLELVYADEKGSTTRRSLDLSDKMQVEVDEKLFADAGMSNTLAKGNDPTADGKLGKLRFVIELSHNENFVDPSGVAASQIPTLVRSLETKFSYEVQFSSIDPVSDELNECSCVFIPRGEGNQRINYDVHTEDLGKANKLKLGELLGSTPTGSRPVKILGRTFDMTKVESFDIELHHPTSGKAYMGRYPGGNGVKLNSRDPRKHGVWFREDVKLVDREDKKRELKLTMRVRVVAILRAQRLKRLLAETFRMVGLEFDARRINEGSDRRRGTAVEDFLWEVCKAHFLPGRNTTEELMAQVHRMRQSRRLHWKFTPELLGMVFEHVFLFGERDRLSFDDAVALDDVLSRWSLVLQHLNEAKAQLVGHLHGRETPRLVHALMSECDWTGFELASLPSGASTSTASGSTSGGEQGQGVFEETVLHEGTKVHALLPARKHAGIPVDVKLADGRYVAGTIVAQHGDDIFDVAFCAKAPITEEGRDGILHEEELPPLKVGQPVFVCPVATKSSVSGESKVHSKAGRTGRVVKIADADVAEPYQIEFDGESESPAEWLSRKCLDTKIHRAFGDVLYPQLVKDDFVRVYSTAGPKRTESGALARILKNHCNGKYDIQYLEKTESKQAVKDVETSTRKQTDRDSDFVTEESVPRVRLEMEKNEKEIYEAKVLRSYISPMATSDLTDQKFVISYDLRLENGDFIQGVTRNELRPHHETFPSDKCVLASFFSKGFELRDEAENEAQVTKWLNELYAHDQLVKVYVMAPAQPQEIALRDLCSTKRLEAKLNRRDTNKPRFVEQCHGYSTEFSAKESAKLNEIFKASLSIREDRADLDKPDKLDIQRCFCLYMAPQPRIEIHGTLRIAADDSERSVALFNVLKNTAVKDKKDDDNRVLALFQMLIRNCASVHMPLDRKGRVVFAKEIKIVSEKELDIVFEISVAPNNLGSLAHEVGVAHRDGNRILERLQESTVLMGFGDQFTSIADVDWVLESKRIEGTPSLKVKVLDKAGQTDKPSLSLEMLPLDDQRLSVLDIEGNVWELCIPMDQVLVGAQLRRHLVPFQEAKVVGITNTCEPKEPQEILAQVNQRSRRDSLLRSKPTEPLKVGKRSSGRRLRVQFGKDLTNVPEHDIKFDALRIVVKQASELILDEGVGQGKLEVKVSLVSSDFRPYSEGDLSLTTPFKEVLSEIGEIEKGVEMRALPLSKQILEKDTKSTDWKASAEPEALVFGHPGIDLERVSHVRIRVQTETGKILVGMSDIPISDVPVTGTTSDASAEEIAKNQAKSSLLSKFLPKKKDGKQPPASSRFPCERTVPLRKTENSQENTVGKITLCVERVQSAGVDDVVLARRFKEEEDLWQISAYELLTLTLKQHDDHMMRGLLVTSSKVPDAGLRLLAKSEEQEQQLQTIANVMMISHAMELIYATKTEKGEAPKLLALRDGRAQVSSPRISDHMKLALTQTKWFIEDTAAELGIRTKRKRLPWSADVVEDERHRRNQDFVVMKANVSNTSTRVRRTMLKLYSTYCERLIPTLQDLYEADAMGDNIDIQKGEILLRFFDREVEDLVDDDRKVHIRVNRRVRLIKIAKVLQDIMHATLIVTVMNNDHAMGDDEIGTAYVPLIDLLDGLQHDNAYELKKKKHNSGSVGQPGSPQKTIQYASSPAQGKVHLRIKLSYSDSSLLEQATRVYKVIKEKFVAQHELARQRINAAVVPAQRRRWMTVKGHLDELQMQSTSKLHWVRTPILLSLVWDIFVTHDQAIQKDVDEDERTHLEGLTEKADEYRSAVVAVHNRWANLQPILEELLQVQAAEKIHAQRTPELLDLIKKEVEGLDLVLSTAYQQVEYKWLDLKDALEKLVRMQQRKKIHLGLAPPLLTKVTNRCSKGLNAQYADAVSEVQFRWMAITKSDGPLNELRLTEKKGLHWRRTHELVRLLHEQCEGFAEVDAKTLNIVQKRWDQVQEWLDDVVQMQIKHTIDCEETPFILKKMHLVESRQKTGKKKRAIFTKKQKQDPSASPRARSPSRSSRRGSDPPSPRGHTSSAGGQGFEVEVDAELDVDRLEGLAEWYAIEESKRELEHIPYHRITTDHDRNNRLKYSQDGKDTRLFITHEEMAFTPQNVRAALVDRGVIPLMASIDGPAAGAAAIGSPTKVGAAMTVPKDLMEEIKHLEESIESMYSTSGSPSALYVQWNPERVAELYLIIESLGKSDLLWKIDHAVSTNHEIEVPSNVNKLLVEMKLRSIQTTEIDDLIRTLLVTLQKEELARHGVTVPSTANFTTVLQLMHRHQVKDIALPSDISEIQTLLQEKAMDKMGDPVFLRGMRIGTQMWNPDDGSGDGAHASVHGKAGIAKINVGLGIVDSKVEQLRKMLLMEALRKRNSLVKTFPVESHILTEEELAECTEVEMSGDFMTLIERFQQLLIHESYTKRLAEYAAMDRCMRALLNVSADTIVTKEDIATTLQRLGSSRFRLPLEAFTREELEEAASKGKIRTPTKEMLARCPIGKNAKAMAYYAAMSHAALVFQETVRFPARFDASTNSFVDAFPFLRASSVDGMSVPKNRSRMSVKEFVVDWLMGSEESVVKIQRHLGEYHRQRLEWASAAFTLRNRWYQRGFGWCDDATRCAGVKVLLQKLLLFEAANKMHMTNTESLLDEINAKCVNLRERERDAKHQLEQRYNTNMERLQTLVSHAEKCINNRKIHAEDAPALLHAIEQACIVPHGLNSFQQQAYHVVSVHWTRHRTRLSELVHMQKQGTFSIKRTPELLSAMEFHTEGIAGADELTMEKVMENASASSTPVEVQQRYVDKKEDEIRRGQRKQSSSLRLNLDDANTEKDIVLEDLKEHDGNNNDQWESLSPSKRDVRPLSPREKQTSWKIVEGDAQSPAKPSIVIEDKLAKLEQRRKSSIGDELRELLKSPSKWLIGTSEKQDAIRPEVFFPREVTIDQAHSTSAAEPTKVTPPPAPATAPQ